jgi:septum formation protein
MADESNERTIVLASGSPRRREMLEKIGLKFEVDPSDYPENLTTGERAEEIVCRIALGKARAVGARHPQALIIAADTIGVIRGRIIGKPHTPEQALLMLQWLNGKSHRVISGLTVLEAASGKQITTTVETRVYFKKLSIEELTRYVSSGEPLDKAGAYAIQGLGSLLVKKIEGDYYNVVGLPLNTLADILKKFGIYLL